MLGDFRHQGGAGHARLGIGLQNDQFAVAAGCVVISEVGRGLKDLVDQKRRPKIDLEPRPVRGERVLRKERGQTVNFSLLEYMHYSE